MCIRKFTSKRVKELVQKVSSKQVADLVEKVGCPVYVKKEGIEIFEDEECITVCSEKG